MPINQNITPTTERHILELGNRYEIAVSDDGFVIHQLALQKTGGWARHKSTYTKSADDFIDKLLRFELQSEEVNSLQAIQKTLNAIRAEFKEAIAVGKSQ